jgi:hypothetical protein
VTARAGRADGHVLPGGLWRLSSATAQLAAMTRIARLFACLAALAAVLGGAATASAVTWHNNGDTAFSATGSAFIFGPNGTTVTASCLGSHLTGSAATGPVTGATWAALHLSQTVTNCKFSPFSATVMSCTYTFAATQQTGLDVTGALASTCVMTASPTNVACHFHGQRTALYHDPTFPGTGYGYLTVTAGGSMIATSGTSACPYGNGTAMPFPEERWTLTTASGSTFPTGHTGPIITRTA